MKKVTYTNKIKHYLKGIEVIYLEKTYKNMWLQLENRIKEQREKEIDNIPHQMLNLVLFEMKKIERDTLRKHIDNLL